MCIRDSLWAHSRNRATEVPEVLGRKVDDTSEKRWPVVVKLARSPYRAKSRSNRPRPALERTPVNKAQLIDAITERIDSDRKAAGSAVEAVVDTITRAVAKGEKVAIAGFGVFERQNRAARTARNPATGATVKVKKTAVPKFRPGKGFKDVVSGAKKLPKTAPAAARTARTARRAAGTAAVGTARATKSVQGTAESAARAATTRRTAAKTTPATGSRTRRAATATGGDAATKTPRSSSRAAGTAKTAAAKSTAGSPTARKSTASKATASKATASKAGGAAATRAAAGRGSGGTTASRTAAKKA